MSSKPANRRSTRGEYIETDTGNKISRRARIEGTPNIILGGRVVVQSDACLRGDLCRLPSSTVPPDPKEKNTRTSIAVGRYTLISSGAVLHPPHRFTRPEGATAVEPSYYPLKLGENVFVGPNAFVAAAHVGNNVHIGAGAIIENGCVIRDRVKILPGSVMAAGTVAGTSVVVGGRPARVVGELPEGWGVGSGGTGGGDMEEVYVEGGELRELIRGIK